jgi:hypothetical protein
MNQPEQAKAGNKNRERSKYRSQLADAFFGSKLEPVFRIGKSIIKGCGRHQLPENGFHFFEGSAGY